MLDLRTPISEEYKKTAEYKQMKAFFRKLDRNPEEKTRFFQDIGFLDKNGNPNRNLALFREAVRLENELLKTDAESR